MRFKWTAENKFSVDPKDPSFFQDPYRVYAMLHERTGPVFWEEYNRWCLTGYDAVSRCLRDQHFARLHPDSKGDPPTYPEHLQDFERAERYSLLALEPPGHTRLRQFVNKAFVTRNVHGLSEDIQHYAHECVDRFIDHGQAELISQFATPIPVNVIAQLIGIPVSRSADLLRWSHAIVKVYTLTQTHEEDLEANQASREFIDFIEQMMDQHRRKPDTSLLSHLLALQSHHDDGPSDDEIVSVCILLLNAGHEATVHQIGNAIRLLIDHGYSERMGTVPIEKVVSECMRINPPLHMFIRYAQKDLLLEDQIEIARGTEVALLLGAANHCPLKFDKPDRFNPERKGDSVTLGGGHHFCVGAALAKLEIAIALKVLFERIPDIKLGSEPVVRDSFHFHGLQSLPVNW